MEASLTTDAPPLAAIHRVTRKPMKLPAEAFDGSGFAALLPVPDSVAAACSFLGLDAISIANEGRLVAMVAPADLNAVMTAMAGDPHGVEACVIAQVVGSHPGVVTAKTRFGATRVVDPPLREQLPRIC